MQTLPNTSLKCCNYYAPLSEIVQDVLRRALFFFFFIRAEYLYLQRDKCDSFATMSATQERFAYEKYYKCAPQRFTYSK